MEKETKPKKPIHRDSGNFRKPATKCWTCENAIPLMVNHHWVRGCSWSICRMPVEGWKAEKFVNTRCTGRSQGTYDSYLVHECPKYKKEKR